MIESVLVVRGKYLTKIVRGKNVVSKHDDLIHAVGTVYVSDEVNGLDYYALYTGCIDYLGYWKGETPPWTDDPVTCFKCMCAEDDEKHPGMYYGPEEPMR